MQNQHSDGLTLEWVPAGRQTVTVTARLNGDVLAVETFAITKGKARADFAESLCDGRPGIERKIIEAELVRMAAEAAATATRQQILAVCPSLTFPVL